MRLNFKQSMRLLQKNILKESPTILTILGAGGVVSTAILAVKATPKALYLIDEENAYRIDYDQKLLRGKEIVKLTWRLYLPAILSGAMAITCIVSANKINLRRNAALVGLYTITEASLKEYQEKVVEMIGENKEEKIRGEIAQDKLNSNPIEGNTIILTGNGDTLFCDSYSGRYFKSNMEAVRKTVNDYNELLLGEMYLTLNEWYDLLGLEEVEGGKMVGWEANSGLLKLEYSAKIATNSVPCIVLTFKQSPKNL